MGVIPSPQPRVLRGEPARPVTRAVIDPVEGLLHTLDGRPVTAEVKAAKDAGFRKGWEAGRQAGFDRGRAEGHEQAYRETMEALRSAADAVQRAADAIDRTDRLTLAALEDEAVELVYHLVEGLLGRELELTDSPVRDALARALALAPDRGAMVVRLHPDDVATIQELGSAVAPGRALELVADPSVEAGGCVVDVGACRVDAQIGPALERARAVLSASRPRRHRGAP